MARSPNTLPFKAKQSAASSWVPNATNPAIPALDDWVNFPAPLLPLFESSPFLNVQNPPGLPPY
ncbi:hypothetical protein K4I79_002464 [Candida tropicalis]